MAFNENDHATVVNLSVPFKMINKPYLLVCVGTILMLSQDVEDLTSMVSSFKCGCISLC